MSVSFIQHRISTQTHQTSNRTNKPIKNRQPFNHSTFNPSTSNPSTTTTTSNIPIKPIRPLLSILLLLLLTNYKYVTIANHIYAPSISSLQEAPNQTSIPLCWSNIQLYSSTIITNTEIRTYNGNKDKGLKIMSWNKGSSYLENSMNIVRQTIQDYNPDIFTLTEAELRPSTPPQLVQVPGYRLHTDSLYSAPIIYLYILIQKYKS